MLRGGSVQKPFRLGNRVEDGCWQPRCGTLPTPCHPAQEGPSVCTRFTARWASPFLFLSASPAWVRGSFRSPGPMQPQISYLHHSGPLPAGGMPVASPDGWHVRTLTGCPAGVCFVLCMLALFQWSLQMWLSRGVGGEEVQTKGRIKEPVISDRIRSDWNFCKGGSETRQARAGPLLACLLGLCLHPTQRVGRPGV